LGEEEEMFFALLQLIKPPTAILVSEKIETVSDCAMIAPAQPAYDNLTKVPSAVRAGLDPPRADDLPAITIIP
jgi:hypothetical protein